MDILFQGNVILVLFALFCSAAIVVIFYVFFLSAITLRNEKEKMFAAACEDVLSNISFDWTFVEQLKDILFARIHEDGEKSKTLEALTFLYGDKISYPSFAFFVVDRLLESLEKSGHIERSTVVYSRDTLKTSPEMFSQLPLWMKDECETTILTSSSSSFGEKLSRVRKMSHEGSCRHSMMKDIGMDARVHLQSLE